ENKKQNSGLHIIILGLVLSFPIIIATTPLHEAAHWIMADIDPYSEPVEFHLFDDDSFKSNHLTSAAAGYITIKESYPGSFTDKPIWIDALQELFCITIQIILTFIIVSKILSHLKGHYPDVLKTTKLTS
ncbi:MAG: hypothetical protein KKG04_06780, partial [Candidatus Thermoplasmatota archaeon]|nr:hypothetical protein [Candidatus Thermoplasmatota archaeon]